MYFYTFIAIVLIFYLYTKKVKDKKLKNDNYTIISHKISTCHEYNFPTKYYN